MKRIFTNLLLLLSAYPALAVNQIQVIDESNHYEIKYSDAYLEIKSQFLKEKIMRAPCNAQSQINFINSISEFLKNESGRKNSFKQNQVVKVLIKDRVYEFSRGSEAGNFFVRAPENFLALKADSQINCRKGKK